MLSRRLWRPAEAGGSGPGRNDFFGCDPSDPFEVCGTCPDIDPECGGCDPAFSLCECDAILGCDYWPKVGWAHYLSLLGLVNDLLQRGLVRELKHYICLSVCDAACAIAVGTSPPILGPCEVCRLIPDPEIRVACVAICVTVGVVISAIACQERLCGPVCNYLYPI